MAQAEKGYSVDFAFKKDVATPEQEKKELEQNIQQAENDPEKRKSMVDHQMVKYKKDTNCGRSIQS